MSTQKPTWSAILDVYNRKTGLTDRTRLVEGKVTRFEAESALHAAEKAHVKETGHRLGLTNRWPGKTHRACECGAAFHATGLKEN